MVKSANFNKNQTCNNRKTIPESLQELCYLSRPNRLRGHLGQGVVSHPKTENVLSIMQCSRCGRRKSLNQGICLMFKTLK